MQDDFTKVEIIKVDAKTQRPLAGATLQVIDAEGNVIFEWVSTTEPFLIERLPQGAYILHEVSAPEGYGLAKDVGFTVDDTAEFITVTMADEKTPVPDIPNVPLDKTGADGSLPFGLIGVLVIAALGGISFALWCLRKKKGADDGTENKEK
jgi:uncharacterized surface anchored protein